MKGAHGSQTRRTSIESRRKRLRRGEASGESEREGLHQVGERCAGGVRRARKWGSEAGEWWGSVCGQRERRTKGRERGDGGDGGDGVATRSGRGRRVRGG